MGYFCHHAIVISSSYPDKLLSAWHRILLMPHLALPVSEILPVAMQGYASFFVGPDGSKEGRRVSNIGDLQRDRIVEILRSFTDEDGFSPLEWAEVQYGDEAGNNKVMRSKE